MIFADIINRTMVLIIFSASLYDVHSNVYINKNYILIGPVRKITQTEKDS